MSANRRRPRLAIAILAVLATACGLTVPVAQQSMGASEAGDGGLSMETAPLAGPDSGTGPSQGTVSSGTTSTTTGPAPSGLSDGAPAGQQASSTGGPSTGSRREPTSGSGTAAGSTGPLKVGLAYIDNEKTQSALGVSSDQTANGRSAARAMVKGVNAAGGLNGREVQAVEYAWDSSGSSWSASAAEACEKFTRDEPVGIVLDAAFGLIGGFGECLQRAGVLHITNGSEGDYVSSRQRSLHANTRSMVDDRTYGAVVANLTTTGYLTPRNQLGVMLEQCPAIERAYNETIKPLVARLGLPAPVERRVECTTSLASAGPGASAVSAAILAFRNAGVDRVMFVSDQEAVLLLLFANNASSQQYFPGYALSSSAQAEFLRANGNLQRDQWPQLHGVGTSPIGDVADDGKEPTGVDARCIRLAKRGGLAVQARSDYAFVYGACGLFVLLEAALARTGNRSDPALLQRAINALGSSFRAPGLVANSTRYSPTEHDGPNAVQVFGYVEKCECLRHRGRPLRAPR